MQQITFFPFQWNYNDERRGYDLRTIIRVWGWNQRNEGVCLRIEDFDIPMWVELPMTFNDQHVTWTEASVLKVSTHLANSMGVKDNMGPSSIDLEYRNRLYNNEFYKDNGVYKSKDFPFLRVCFRSQKALLDFAFKLNNPQDIPGIGKILLRTHCSSKNLTPVMKLFAIQKIPSSNWIFGRGTLATSKQSNKQYEFIVSAVNLMTHPKSDSLPIVHPKVCSFDIETYSSDHNRFPDYNHPDDKILQVGCTFAKKGVVLRKVVLTLGQPVKPEQADDVDDISNDDFTIITYPSEAKLLVGWSELVLKEDPDVLIGYNIFGFDIRYMVKRAEMCGVWVSFAKFGCISSMLAEYLETKWESSARGIVESQFLNAQGRLFIDLLPVIRASENLENYKLETVAAKHLKVNKDPIKAKDIFKCWAQQNMELLWSVSKYCVQDTYVTFLLFEKLLIWLGLVESATTNKVPIFCMVSQGQQIKAYSQVFDFTYTNRMVCNVPPKKNKMPYEGAIVTEPVAGLYKVILPFDFASLYPNIIRAYNIDFSRFVCDDTIPESDVHHFTWTTHSGCIHDPEFKETKPRYSKATGELIVPKKPKKVICNTYNYKFLKQQVGGAGVVPTIITELLDARKKVRKIIEKQEDRIEALKMLISNQDPDSAEYKKEIERLKEVNAVLDKRQLAFKVNANSMYGMYGADTGYLPFFPGAETVTYVGRSSIIKASRHIEEVHKGKVIYNDTDSAYCYFEHMANKSVPEIWKFAEDIVTDIETIFPKPMKLEFEGKIYMKFAIFCKKKYIALPVDEKGKAKDKLYMRGVPLVLRSYIANFKQIYGECINYIFKHTDEITAIPVEERGKSPMYQHILNTIFENFINVMCRRVPLQDFTIYKGLTKEKYATPQAHAAVAEKMKNRGHPVAVNSRLEYVLLSEPDGIYDGDKKQYQITEDLAYFKEYNELLKLDYHQYFVSQYINFLDKIMSAIFGMPDIVHRMVWYTNAKHLKTGTQLKNGKFVGRGGSFLDKNRLLAELKKKWQCRVVIQDSSVPTFTQTTLNFGVSVNEFVASTTESSEWQSRTKVSFKPTYQQICTWYMEDRQN